MAGFFATYLAGLSDYTLEVTEIMDTEDKVVVACHDTARLAPGLVERDFVHVWTVTARDSSASKLQDDRGSPRSRRAAGVA